MPQHLLSIYQSDNGAPGPATMARIVADLHKLNDELRESGSWVFNGGLHARSLELGVPATVLPLLDPSAGDHRPPLLSSTRSPPSWTSKMKCGAGSPLQ